MALSGSVATSAYNAGTGTRTVEVSWTATQDISNNRSTISWQIKGAGTFSGWVSVGEIRLKIAGSQVYYRNSSTHTNTYNGTVLASGTTTLKHSADGSKSFAISIEAGIYNYAINKSGSKTFTLNTIPRASTISCSTLTMNTAGTISVSRASTSFTHTISYVFGTKSGTICTKSSSVNVSWTPPLSLANVIPNATSGTGSLTCDTYNGDTKIGSKSISFTCSVPTSVKPSLGVAYSNTNNVFNCYAKLLSGVKITPTASGAYGSTIKSIIISVTDKANKTATSGTAYTFTPFESTGTKTIQVKVSDSRNRTNTVTYSISVVNYTKPSANVSASRGTGTSTSNFVAGDTGNAAKITASGSVFNISGNTLTASLKYRVFGTSSWTNITPTTSGMTLNSSHIISASDTNAYEISLTITDKAGQSATSAMTLSNGFATLDFLKGGNGIAFGMTARETGFDCAMIMRMLNSMYLQNDTSGSSGKAYWYYNNNGTQRQVGYLYGNSDGFHIQSSNSKGFLDGTWSGTLSDARLKCDIEPIAQNIIRAVGEVPFKQFRMQAEGYDHNELYVGILAQDLEMAFSKYGVKDKLLMLDKRKINNEKDEYFCIEYTHFLIVRVLYNELLLQSYEDRLIKIEKLLNIQ